MNSIRFCYRISPEAEMAIDNETGEFCEAYLQVEFEDAKKEVPYQIKHEEIKFLLAQQMDINPNWLTPISTEEYDAEMEDAE